MLITNDDDDDDDADDDVFLAGGDRSKQEVTVGCFCRLKAW